MTIEQFLDKLENVQRSGNGFSARCPAHNDRVSSLGVREYNDRILCKCHAECPTEDVVAAMGLSMSDLFLNQQKREEPEAVYQYTDEKGELLYEAVRFPGKQFRYRRQDPETRELIWGLDGTRRVLYHLPEVADSLSSQTVYITEGEKDTDALRAVGRIATCNPMGAGAWKDEYSQWLANRNIIIVADKDEPGIEHAQKVARSLDGIAKAVKVVQAKTGKDAADHLEAGHDVNEFVQVSLTDARRHYQPLDLFQPVPPVDWVVENIVVGGEATLLVADGGAGKSFFALAMSLAVATGQPFLGQGVKRGRVLYCDEEGSPDLALQRLAQLGATDEAKKNLEYLNFAGVEIVQHPDRIIEDAKLVQPVLVIFDSHAKVTRSADENATSEMDRAWTDGFLRLARETKAAVLVIHHTNADGSRSRGNTQIRNSADQVLTMSKQPDDSQVVWPSKPRRLTNRIHFEFTDCGDGRYALEPYGSRMLRFANAAEDAWDQVVGDFS